MFPKERKMRTNFEKSSAAVFFIIIVACIIPGSVSADPYWSKSEYLQTGSSVIYQLQIDCGAQLVLQSPIGTGFNVYAMRSTTENQLSENEIRELSDVSDLSSNQYKYLNLDQGNWYVVVYAQSGYGQFQLSASETCYNPVPPTSVPTYAQTEVPIIYPCNGDPNCDQTNCAPAATDVKTASLNSGESRTYSYLISSDRNYIEWVLTGSCGNDVIPMAMMSTEEVRTLRTDSCGSDFSLYIFKDCDPQSQTCKAIRADTSSGSSKYVGITFPTTGSNYIAQVYDKSGSGAYTLTARSYNCQDDVIAMMEKKTEIINMMSTETDVSIPISVYNSD